MATQPTPGQFIRARQRSRTALRAFSTPLAPSREEVGVDRLRLTAFGMWRVEATASRLPAEEVIEHLVQPPLDVGWFRQPERDARGRRSLKTRSSQAEHTMGYAEFQVAAGQGRAGTVRADFRGLNPTRTLAHLVAEHGEAEDFAMCVSELSPFEFFRKSRHGVQRGYGQQPDNWLGDRDAVDRALGPNAFDAFLPIFVNKVQQLATILLSPSDTRQYREDGACTVVSDGDVTCRWQWDQVRVPQIECYFERRHARVVGFVRDAATVAISDLDQTQVARYANYESAFVERVGDCLSIRTDLSQTRRLKLYAKSRDCLRFEVERHGKGDYSRLDPPVGPQDRLMGILDLERDALIESANWEAVGERFVEREQPQMSDLARLCGIVAATANRLGLSAEPILQCLIESGGSELAPHRDLTEETILQLARQGVLKTVTFRNRAAANVPRRYVLAPQYRDLIEVIRSALGPV